MTIRTRTVARLLCALAFTASFTISSHAQFSGPSLTVPSQAPTVQIPTSDPALLNPAYQDLKLSPGDLISVRIFGVPEYANSIRVSVDGTVQLPLLGPVLLSGITVNQAEDLIAQRLIAAGMYNNPQVTVIVTEAAGQYATVSGELHAVVPLLGNRRLFDVLAAAGNLPVTASHIITILRPGLVAPIIVDLGTDPARSAEANIQIFPRDTILISRVGVVYIVGAFARQGAIPLDQNTPLTLMEATALSGGENFEGKYNDLRIIRTVGLERKFVKVDLKKILHGADPDPVLQANDIVYLPPDNLKAAFKYGGINTITSIVSLLLVAFPRQ